MCFFFITTCRIIIEKWWPQSNEKGKETKDESKQSETATKFN